MKITGPVLHGQKDLRPLGEVIELSTLIFELSLSMMLSRIAVQRGTLKLKPIQVASTANIADLMTKSLDVTYFRCCERH